MLTILTANYAALTKFVVLQHSFTVARNMTHLVYLVLLSFLNASYCAKILGVFPSPGYSQFILAERLMTELVNRGHEVTVISPFSPTKKVNNYNEIRAAAILEAMKGKHSRNTANDKCCIIYISHFFGNFSCIGFVFKFYYCCFFIPL